MTDVFLRERQREIWGHRERERRNHVMKEAEVGGMWPQAKENLETPDALAGSPLPGRGEEAPPLMSASVGFRPQPSIAEESPRNGVFVGP